MREEFHSKLAGQVQCHVASMPEAVMLCCKLFPLNALNHGLRQLLISTQCTLAGLEYKY